MIEIKKNQCTHKKMGLLKEMANCKLYKDFPNNIVFIIKVKFCVIVVWKTDTQNMYS